MKNLSAEIVSIIFHPILFSLLLPLVVIYRQTTNEYYALKWTIFSAAFVLLAVLVLVISRAVGIFSDFDISKKEERPLFYYVTLILALLYFLAAVILKGIFFSLSLVSFGIVLALVAFRTINNYVKASIHLGVSCSFAITIIMLYRNAYLWLLLLIPVLLSWSRLTLKRHTLKEIIAGSSIGTLVTLLTFLIAKFVL